MPAFELAFSCVAGKVGKLSVFLTLIQQCPRGAEKYLTEFIALLIHIKSLRILCKSSPNNSIRAFALF